MKNMHSLMLLAALATLTPALAQTPAPVAFATSSEASDKDAFKSSLAEKLSVYPKLQKAEAADWAFKAPGFSVEDLKGQAVAFYAGSIKRAEGPFAAKELATYYPMDLAPFVESGLKGMGLDLYRSPEAKAGLAESVQSKRDLESGKKLKEQMEKNPQMAAAMKMQAQQNPQFAEQMRRMGITFDEPQATKQEGPARPFQASPLEQKGYAVVILVSDLRDVAAERQKGGFFSNVGKAFTALKTTSELYVLKDGIPVAVVRDTVAYQAGSPTRGSERLLAALR